MPYHKIHYSSHVKLYTTLNNHAVQFVYAYQVNYLYMYLNWLVALQDSVSLLVCVLPVLHSFKYFNL